MSKRIPPVLARLVVVCLTLFAPAAALAQATTGDIEGRVLDPNGAVVPNATVSAKNKDTGLERIVTTDGEGNYRIILLPPGNYNVHASMQGFNQRSADNVTVTVGSKTTLDLELFVGGLTGE